MPITILFVMMAPETKFDGVSLWTPWRLYPPPP
jgi:hypothetical protein